MKRTRMTALAVTGLVTAFALAACSKTGSTATSTSSGTVNDIKVGTFLDVTSWDPGNADIGFDGPYLSAVYDSLVQLDAQSQVVPGLATSWSWSPDHLILTMHLRSGVKFTDGQTFDADAAVTNLQHLMKGVRSGQAYLNVASVSKTDASTVELHMKQRDDSLLYFMGLGRSWIASPAAITSNSLTKAPDGSGPYTYDTAASRPQSQYVFKKKADYWDAATYPFPTVELLPITDQTASFNAMLSGQLNVQFANATNTPKAKQQGWNISSGVATWVGLQFADRTGKQSAALGDERVRQAISYAFDGAGILKAVGNGNGVATDQLWPVTSAVYNKSNSDQYKTDLAKAKQLLAAAGYAQGFSVDMPMSPIFQAWQPAANQTFSQLGIKVHWVNMQMADYQKNAPSYPMFIAVVAMDSNDIATLTDQVTSKQWYNPNPSVDAHPDVKALVDQVNSASPSEQTALLQKLNDKLVGLAWWDVWYQANNTYFSVKGVKVTPITGMMFPTLRFIQRG